MTLTYSSRPCKGGQDLPAPPSSPMNGNVPAPRSGRPVAAGKFLSVDGEKLLLRGVTYGTFADSRDGRAIPDRGKVRDDFAAMAESGINTVRLYMPPPQWV